MLVGQKVRLRAIETSDYVLLSRWLNDSEVMVFWGRPGNTASLSEVAQDEDTKRLRENSRKYIIETIDGVALGQIDFYDLDWQARSAWISIMIGEERYWGAGFGTDAVRTLLKYLFHQLGLHRVALTAHVGNERALRSYRKNGFVSEGTLRDWAFFNGTWVDGVLMSVLDRDFVAALKPTSTPDLTEDSSP